MEIAVLSHLHINRLKLLSFLRIAPFCSVLLGLSGSLQKDGPKISFDSENRHILLGFVRYVRLLQEPQEITLDSEN